MSTDVHTKMRVQKRVDVTRAKSSSLALDEDEGVLVTVTVEATTKAAADRVLKEISAAVDRIKAKEE